MLDQGRAHVFDDQLALEALVRFSNDEIKHQELFRRIETMISTQLPTRYRQVADPNDVARAVLAASTWSVLALTCHIELFVQTHYVQSIAPREELCPLFKDVFKFHWKDESRHVVLDELEWEAEHAKLSPAERDQAVNDLIALVAAVDTILPAQSASDADYFIRNVSRSFSVDETAQIKASVLSAYRWQYIVSGVQHPHFGRLLTRNLVSARCPLLCHWRRVGRGDGRFRRPLALRGTCPCQSVGMGIDGTVRTHRHSAPVDHRRARCCSTVLDVQRWRPGDARRTDAAPQGLPVSRAIDCRRINPHWLQRAAFCVAGVFAHRYSGRALEQRDTRIAPVITRKTNSSFCLKYKTPDAVHRALG